MKVPSQLIVITGFMGAGKTTVAAALARRLNRPVLDLDEFIAAREGRTIQAIIEKDGEARFREIETRALKDVLENNASGVIALGGGCWTLERNRALISGHDAFTVWLDAPFDLCWQRIISGTGVRPLARDEATARTLYNQRRALYESATLRVRVDARRSIDDMIAEIMGALTLL